MDPARAPLSTKTFSRARFGEQLFFFSASSDYLKGAFTLLMFTLGCLLVLDFALGDTNLVKVFTGRERRSMVMDALSSVSMSEVLMHSSSFGCKIISLADYGEGRGGLRCNRKV